MSYDELKNDVLLVAALKLDSHEAFVKIFRQYYANLVLFASRYIPDKNVCEDIVQEAFLKIWANRKELEIKTSIRSFMIKSVQNLALDELRHTKVKTAFQDMNHEAILSLSPEEHMFFTELNDAFESTLQKLQPELLETLMLSKRDSLKHSEIASKLNISIRTVESRISKAMKFIQKSLIDYQELIIIITLCFNFF